MRFGCPCSNLGVGPITPLGDMVIVVSVDEGLVVLAVFVSVDAVVGVCLIVDVASSSGTATLSLLVKTSVYRTTSHSAWTKRRMTAPAVRVLPA
jgi:hypothetical protein